jgi:hypothetical protein
VDSGDSEDSGDSDDSMGSSDNLVANVADSGRVEDSCRFGEGDSLCRLNYATGRHLLESFDCL